MNYNEDRRNKLGIAIIITLLFILIHTGNNNVNSNDYYRQNSIHIPTLRAKLEQPNHYRRQTYNGLIKIRNTDASLFAPYLDQVNKNWHVGGSTLIRNNGNIQLTRIGEINKSGSLLSNGVGDKKINNFETVYDFKIEHSKGDGMAFVMTSENGFIWRDLTSSYAMRQYMTNTNGILAHDTTMMGFPKNLPGLAIVLQTSSYLEAPECDIFLNLNPEEHFYDFESFGKTSSAIKLNKYSIRLNGRILDGERIRLRVIYLESINFLKIDISYTQGKNWEELYINQNLEWELPKNKRSGERYIGVSSLSKHHSQSVTLYSVLTNEFHWANSRDETMEISNEDFKKDALKFIQSEYGVVLGKERNTQPYKQVTAKDRLSYFNIYAILKIVGIFIIMIIAYIFSIYIRVIRKHIRKLRKKRSTRNKRKYNNDMLLPI